MIFFQWGNKLTFSPEGWETKAKVHLKLFKPFFKLPNYACVCFASTLAFFFLLKFGEADRRTCYFEAILINNQLGAFGHVGMYKNIHLVPINLMNVFIYLPKLIIQTLREDVLPKSTRWWRAGNGCACSSRREYGVGGWGEREEEARRMGRWLWWVR